MVPAAGRTPPRRLLGEASYPEPRGVARRGGGGPLVAGRRGRRGRGRGAVVLRDDELILNGRPTLLDADAIGVDGPSGNEEAATPTWPSSGSRSGHLIRAMPGPG